MGRDSHFCAPSSQHFPAAQDPERPREGEQVSQGHTVVTELLGLGLPLLPLDPLTWKLASDFAWPGLVQTGVRGFLNQKFPTFCRKHHGIHS